MAINKEDFVEIEYTGKIKEDNIVFDTTDEKVAKENNLFNKSYDYGPVIVCVGKEQVLKGIDESIIGKDAGNSYKIDLKPEQGFGKKDAKLIQLIPTNKFKKQNIQPVPGLQVNLDGLFGVIKTVSGGRTLVDFNHPLSGKELSYDIKINRLVTDNAEKIKGFLRLAFGITDCEVALEGEKAKIQLKTKLEEKITGEIGKKISEVIPAVKSVEIAILEEQKNK